MTVRIEKPAINVREELADLRKPTGIAGEAMLRAETPQEQFNLIGAGRRNVITNGAMQVAQRGTSFTTVSDQQYCLDRWVQEHDAATFDLDIEQTSGPTEEGFPFSLKATVQTTATLSTAGYIIPFEQRIEFTNMRNLAFGTAKATSLVVSFWIKSNRTGSYTVDMTKGGPTKTVIMPYTINSADVWEKKSLVIPPDTVDAVTGNVTLFWWMIAGSNYTSGTTQSEWAAQVAANRAVGCSNSTTVGDYWQITGVQLELGKVATPFEHRSYGEELALCQRYYWSETGSGDDLTTNYAALYSSTYSMCIVDLPVTMRAKPTVSAASYTSTVLGNYHSRNRLQVYLNSAASSVNNIVADAEL
jgi:hypothetical protein